MDPIDSFDGEGFRFVDFQNAPPHDILTGRRILWDVLQDEILNRLRPGVGLCRATFEEDQGCDPTKGVINFVVYRARQVVGVLNLYNVEPNGRGWVAAVMPGFRPTDSWGDVMSFILENDLPQSGRKLDFVGWNYPSIEGHKWHRDIIADQTMDRLEERGHIVTRRSDGSPSDTRKL